MPEHTMESDEHVGEEEDGAEEPEGLTHSTPVAAAESTPARAPESGACTGGEGSASGEETTPSDEPSAPACRGKGGWRGGAPADLPP